MRTVGFEGHKRLTAFPDNRVPVRLLSASIDRIGEAVAFKPTNDLYPSRGASNVAHFGTKPHDTDQQRDFSS